MTGPELIVSRPAVTLFLLLGLLPSPLAASDLSRYRDFQLGADLATVASQAGVTPAVAKAVHRRPALIQEIAWRPQPLGWSAVSEPAHEGVFSFFNGKLFRIAIDYDRYETEGLTGDDIAEALSATYGPAERLSAWADPADALYGDQFEIVARWQDARYRFDLMRSAYGPNFRLVGVLRKLDAEARLAILEAGRLDDNEAPQREAARILRDEDAAKARLQKARLVNKPKFRP